MWFRLTWWAAWPALNALFVLMTIAAGCAGAPVREPPPSVQLAVRKSVGAPVLYVVRRGWHVDIGIAVEQLSADLAGIAAHWPGATSVLFGFGDQRYLMSRDAGSSSGLAALWPGPGLILVTALRGEMANAFGKSEVLVLPATAAQARRAEDFIWGSLLARNQTGGVKPVAAGPYDGSVYYAATAIYSGTHTCNTWAAEVLEAAGLPVESAGVVLAGQVWRRARCLTVTPASAAADQVSCAVPAR